MAFWHNVKTFDSFKYSSFRVYFMSVFWLWSGQNIQQVAQSLLIYRLTGSTAILGLMVLVTAVPQLIATLFAGVLADRFPKKRLIQGSQVFQGLSTIGVAVALATGYVSLEHAGSWWVIIAASVAQSIISSLTSPAFQAIFPEMVGKENVMNAMSLNTIGSSALSLVAPAIGGFLIDAINFEAVYFIAGALFLIGAVIANFIPVTGTTSIKGRNAIADIAEGFKYAWNRQTILYIILFTFICVIFVQPQVTLTPVFADSILKVGATGFGLLQSASGGGILLAALVLASLPTKKRGIIMLGSGLGLGITLVAFAFSRSMPFSLFLMVIIGMGKFGHYTVGTTLIQSNTDTAYLGRSLSILQLSMGLGGLSSFIISILAEKVGVQWAVGGFALILIPVSILALIFWPKVRRLD